MVPVARAKSLLMVDDKNVFAADYCNYTGVVVRSTTGICCLKSIFADESQDVRANIIRSSSRALALPSYTRVMVRTVFSASDDGCNWFVSDPYYKRVCGLHEYDLLRVITITDDEDFNSEKTVLTELIPAPEKLLDDFRGWQFAPKLNQYPLFFRKSPGDLLPSYYYRRNTVWDRVLSVSKSRLQSVVTMTSDRQCGVFLDGVVVLVPQAP